MLLAQVQSAAAASLEKAAVKVAALSPLVGRKPTETLHLPQQFVNTPKDSGKHVFDQTYFAAPRKTQSCSTVDV